MFPRQENPSFEQVDGYPEAISPENSPSEQVIDEATRATTSANYFFPETAYRIREDYLPDEENLGGGPEISWSDLDDLIELTKNGGVSPYNAVKASANLRQQNLVH